MSSESCSAALAKAQGAFEAAEKAGKNNFGKYATLESVFEATKTGRQENGLAVVQLPGNIGDAVAVTTILGHSSGQWIESVFAVRPVKFDAQGAGSGGHLFAAVCADEHPGDSSRR